MSVTIEQTEFRQDVLKELRALASRGAGVRELVAHLQNRLGFAPDAHVGVLAYFCRAFHVPLPAVLPIREWMGTDNDEEIDRTVLPAIQRTKAEWARELEQEVPEASVQRR